MRGVYRSIRQTDRQIDRQRDRETDSQTERQTDRETDRQRDRRTDGQTDTQTDRQTEKKAASDPQALSKTILFETNTAHQCSLTEKTESKTKTNVTTPGSIFALHSVLADSTAQP